MSAPPGARELDYNERVLNRIGLKNFKLHEDTSIEASRITVFIGPNNSGKSSVFQALLLVRQAALRHDQFLCQPATPQASGPYQYSPQISVDLGAFKEIVRRTSEDLYLQFSGVVFPPSSLTSEPASTTVELRIRENKLVFHAGTIQVAGKQASWEFVEGSSRAVALGLDEVTFSPQATPTFELTTPTGYRWDGGQAGFPAPADAILRWNQFAQWFGFLPLNLLRSVHPVYPLRGFEEWGYPITDSAPPGLDFMTLHDRSLALPNALASDLRLKERLSAQLEALLRVRIDYENVGGRVKLWAKPPDRDGHVTLYANEGTGASQVPFILVPVLLTPENETIVLCEPEAHLHPKGQTELTALLLTIAERRKLQLFIETHSEHVLHKLLHAVATGKLAHEDLTIYYFENNKGKAEVSKLKIDENGGVEGGLPGFFDQSLDELTEYLEALNAPKA